MRTYILLAIAALLFAVPAHAITVGNINTDLILDNAQKYGIPTVTQQNIESVGSYISQGVTYVGETASTVIDDAGAQFQNKENAMNQNKDVDVAKKNLDNSKQNVANMFLLIVGTLVVVTDALISIIYIMLILLMIWLVFVGYSKLMILVIDFISGRLERKGVRRA